MGLPEPLGFVVAVLAGMLVFELRARRKSDGASLPVELSTEDA